MSQESYPSILYGAMSTYIISAGMLVRIGSVMSISEDETQLGLIIGRNDVGLGFNDDWWEVLVNGAIIKLTGTSIWPVESYDQEAAWESMIR